MKLKFIFRRRCENGMAVLVVIVLLSIMAVFVLSNGRALGQLKQELKLIEKRQQRVWETKPPPRADVSAVTNAVAKKSASAAR